MTKGAAMYRILVADDEPIERLVIDKKIKAFSLTRQKWCWLRTEFRL